MKKYSGIIYVTLLTVIAVALAATYIPGAVFLGAWATPPVVLFLGLLFAFVFGQPYPVFNKKMSKMLLQYSVVGLGFGMNVEAALVSGKDGMMFTIISVFGTLLLGWLVGRVLLKVDKNTSYLISSGTAICGGSAIAAVGPVIKAKDCEMSVALGTVFILNAVALFIFPPIGRCLGLDDVQFGTWAAIAIHDTSSVVGAGAAYSEAALEVATTIKLTRALWIIPVALITCVLFKSKDKKTRAHVAFNQAECYRILNNSKAVNAYKNAIRYHYHDSIVYLHYAQVLQYQGKYKDAIKQYDIYLWSYYS